jgi:hypothetical protein
MLHANEQLMYFYLNGHGHSYMDTTHFEYATHAPHLDVARGKVLNCGLGMGFAMYNFAAKPEVTQVVTVELDPELVALFPQFSGYDYWPEHIKAKCSIINQSALTKVDSFEPDHIFVDIGKWCLGKEPEIMDRAKEIAALYPGAPISVWTQEKLPHREDFPLARLRLPEDYDLEIVSLTDLRP